MDFIELNLENCRNRLTCCAAIETAEKVFVNNLASGKVICCAICGRLIEKRFRSAVRSFYDSKTLLLHPVHISCIQDHSSIDDLFKNKQFIDMSALDFISLVGLVDTAHKARRSLGTHK